MIATREDQRQLPASSDKSSSRRSTTTIPRSFGIAFLLCLYFHINTWDSMLLSAGNRTPSQLPTATSFASPLSLLLQTPNLPEWVGHYVVWHKQQRRRYIDALRSNETSSADDVRFLIVRCLRGETCGGTSDRLQDMPYNLLLANQTSRVLLLRWEIPVALENYLIPHDDGIDWTLEGEIYDSLKDRNWHLWGKEDNGRLKIVSTIRRLHVGVPSFRMYERDRVGGRQKIYGVLLRLLFAPSPALAKRVDYIMSSLDLVPSQYSSIHLRMKYPKSKGGVWTTAYQQHRSEIMELATNAVSCAKELHPNATIYVSSDNNDTIGYLLEEFPFAKHNTYTDTTTTTTIDNHTYHSSSSVAVRLVAREYSIENAHIAFSKVSDVEGYMNVFEDLMIMGMGKCVVHGLGGYGRMGAALTNGECAVDYMYMKQHGMACTQTF